MLTRTASRAVARACVLAFLDGVGEALLAVAVGVSAMLFWGGVAVILALAMGPRR